MVPGITSVASPLSPADPPDPKTLAAKVQNLFMEAVLQAMSETSTDDRASGFPSSVDLLREMFPNQMALISSQLRTPAEQVSNPLSQPQPEAVEAPGAPAALPVNGVISSPVGWRRDPFNGEMKFHKGTDIAAPAGSPIRAVEEGVVIESGAKGGYGNAVVVQLADGRKMLYGHNQSNLVRVGDRVLRGDVIAQVGATGHATGPHVHFEIME